MEVWLKTLLLATALVARVTTTQVELRWNADPSAAQYEIARAAAPDAFAVIGTSTTNAYTDTPPAGAYLYRVRALDSGGVPSAWSNVVLAQATSFADDPLVPRLTAIRATHVVQLRASVNGVRTLAGLAPATFADAPNVRAAHVTDLRTALDAARAALSLPPPSYAQTLTPGSTKVFANDLAELRAATTGRSAAGEALHWTRVPGRANVHAMIAAGAEVYVTKSGTSLERSDDHGANWTPVAVPYSGTTALAYLVEGGVAGGVSGGVLYRVGYGTLTNFGYAITALLAAPEGLYIGLNCNGVRFRDRRTAVFSNRSTGVGACVSALARNSAGHLFAGTSDNGVFRSTDGGVSWSAASSGITDVNVHAIAVDRDGRVFAATHGGIFRSPDNGTSWTSVSALDARSLHVDSTGELLAGTHATGEVFLAANGGTSWTAIASGLPGSGMVEALASSSRYRFAAVDGLLYRAPIGFRLHGLNFSPYMDGQNPNYGSIISPSQIVERMQRIAPYTRWIRTFGSTSGLEHSGRIARTLGLKTALGAWIGPDAAANARELDALVANAADADLLIVGSEALLRGNVTPATLIGYIDSVRHRVPNVPVAYADTYGVLLANPTVLAAIDVVLANYYPFWENVPIEQAIASVDEAHRSVVAAAGGKPVIVSETGWPSAGRTDATPENAAFFLLHFLSWARANRVESFYFEAYDEAWKSVPPGQPVESHWGLWDSAGNLKPGMEGPLAGDLAAIPGGPGEPSLAFTFVPAYGSFDDLRGEALHVDPNTHRIAVYIRVGTGWWTKPTFASPLTSLGSDGSWICDITTGGSDQNANRIAAFLVPSTYAPPQMSGSATLPQALYDHALANVEVSRSP